MAASTVSPGQVSGLRARLPHLPDLTSFEERARHWDTAVAGMVVATTLGDEPSIPTDFSCEVAEGIFMGGRLKECRYA